MNEKTESGADKPLPTVFLLSIAYLGFVSLGLPDPIAGVAWPSVRDLFSLPQSGFGLVFIALGCGYCASGFFGGTITHAMGLGNLLWVSSGLVALGMFGFSLAPSWPLFVACAVIWGLGSGGIDSGLNAYSSKHFSAKHVNWLHACYSVGATLGPLLMTVMLYWGSWRIGYASVGGLLLVMMVIFIVTRDRWTGPDLSENGEVIAPISMVVTLREPLVWLQMVLFFLYVGVEFTVGQWSFTILTESRHLPTDVAGPLASGYYAAIGIGRIVAGVIAARFGLDLLIRCAMIAALAGTLLFAFGGPVELSCTGLIVIGLGLAPMFPCLMAKTPQRLGADVATHAVGFQASAGMVGAALMPGLAGILSDTISLESVASFAVLLSVLLLATHEVILSVARHRR
ncbi:MFS transporter [Schlesneria paludicola]|uniref:MFS transporter n=1 Tax=Schlesneria paludicola TaxID=360056 RepID=UPI00029B4D8E|nr:MFS transporter [Schlesneria paludicola]